eukprot:TRINITY_DN1988_c0_g1_i5.p1 TRINITY_DN1988_c0_g1~~TRINITY_DN1988_c0_g1_i5.p1  ORF type:complete len:374 (-),score=35.71 TRINITY_DN1988_c0_g1_i5:231-1352(-)
MILLVFLMLIIWSCYCANFDDLIDFEQKREELIKQAKRKSRTYNATQTSLGYFGVCVLVRDEQPDMREWVQYHLWRGVNKIYVLDSQSNPPMNLFLQDFIDSGHIDYYYFKDSWMADDFEIENKIAKQIPNYKSHNDFQLWAQHSCLRWFGHRHKFMAIFDVDEFLVFPGNNQITFPEYLKDFEEFGGLRVYRRFFGSNGHIQSPNATVLESYTKCTKNVDDYGKQRNPKQIVNMKYYAGVCGVHWCITTKPSVNSQKVERTNQNRKYGIYKPTFEGIQLNHYFVKSWEDMRLKWVRKTGGMEMYEANKEKIEMKRERFYNEVNNVTTYDCMEGVELAKLCCQNIKTYNYIDWSKYNSSTIVNGILRENTEQS